MIHRIRTIDAHAAGEPLRLIIDGLPAPEGKTMLEKRSWAQKRLDHLRRGLILEPRGHVDMYGALLTEPVSPDANAGLLFMFRLYEWNFSSTIEVVTAALLFVAAVIAVSFV